MLIVNHSSTELEKENSYSFHAAVLSTLTASLAASDPLESSWVWALKWTRTTSASSNLHHPYFIPTPSLPTPTSQQGALSVPSHFLCIHLASSLPGEKSKNLKAQEMRFHKDKQTTCATLVLLEWSEVLESPSQVHMFQALGFGKWMFLPQFSGSSLLRGYFYEDSLFTLFAGKQKAVTMWMVPVSVNSYTIRKLVSFL